MVTWILEKGVFPESESAISSLVDVVYLEGMNPAMPRSCESGIFYGSIPKLRRAFKLCPNVITWAYDKVYDCSYYSQFFGTEWINHKHIFIEAGNAPSFLLDFAYGDVFIKQNSGWKNFTGHVYDDYTKSLLTDLWFDDLLLVSRPIEVTSEWRFVITSHEEHKILTYSRYWDGTESESGLVQYVEKILKMVEDYTPAPMWTLDIGKTSMGFRVVEVNGLLAAGWYQCDAEAIVVEANLHLEERDRQ